MKHSSIIKAKERFIAGIISIAFPAIITISCVPPKRETMIAPAPIPPLHAKIYEASNIDWKANRKFFLELREIGKPDTASNQILERYLLQQAEDIFLRKGYVLNEFESDFTVRLFFGTRKAQINRSTELTYGYARHTAGTFLTQYSSESGVVWRAAQLAATAWATISQQGESSFHIGQITVEIFGSGSGTQLWRGDIEAELAIDDIRLRSNEMLREVLWHLPAVGYSAVRVPEMSNDEAESFWDGWILNREFYAPGQRYPICLDYAHYDNPLAIRSVVSREKNKEKALSAAKEEFEQTETYKRIRTRNPQPITAFYGMPDEESPAYRREFAKFIDNIWNPRQVQPELRPLFRHSFAVADLLMTAPWSVRDESGTIVIAGRYLIDNDVEPTIIAIRASLQSAEILETNSNRYLYQKHFISKIETITSEEYGLLWRTSIAQRQRAFGRRIDLIPDEPMPTNHSN